MSGRRPVVKTIAESLSQHGEKHVGPTPFSRIYIFLGHTCLFRNAHVMIGIKLVRMQTMQCDVSESWTLLCL
jgi:hypothetical protein